MRVSELWLRSADTDATRTFLDEQFPGFCGPERGQAARLLVLDSGADPSLTNTERPLSNFWKISAFCDDVDRTRTALISAGTSVSEPVQFGDIGYLCHLDEPGGNAVELLQRTFRQSPAVAGNADSLGLITLRIQDVEASATFYRDGLGLPLLATMAIDDGRPDPVDLFFFGAVAEVPPVADPAAVGNREWLYQRPETLIELQWYRDRTHAPRSLPSAFGLHSIHLQVEDVNIIADRLAAIGCATVGFVATDGQPALSFDSPDGHRFQCTRVRE